MAGDSNPAARSRIRLIRTALIVITLVGGAAASACGLSADRATAEAAVASFHSQYNAGAFQALYASSAPEFKTATRESDWLDFMSTLKRKAGPFTSAQQTAWQVNGGTGGSSVNVSYDSVFGELKATERFSFDVRDGKALLVGYRVESPALRGE